MISVTRLSDDGLSGRVWEFRPRQSANGLFLVLDRYMEGSRPTTRHKLRGEQWDSMDERRYHSALPRPSHIPQDVIQEAMSKILFKVSIGWTTDDAVVGEVYAA